MKVRRILRAIFLVFVLEPAPISAETLAKQGTSTSIGICPSCKRVRTQLVPDDRSKITLNEGPKVEAAYFNGRLRGMLLSSLWSIGMTMDENETKQAGTYGLRFNRSL